MKCPECEAAGLKSNVYIGGGVTTAMYCQPYYDEAGVYHNHDMNTTTMGYSCSNGHKWSQVQKNKCPAPNCDWNK